MGLIERLRAARESWVKVGEVELLVRRPTRYQLSSWQDEPGIGPLRHCIVGWRGVSEITLGIPGGDGREVPFDPDLCLEWLEDRPEELAAAMKAVADIIAGHLNARESARGN